MESRRIEPFAVVALIILAFLGGRAVWDYFGRPPIIMVEWVSQEPPSSGGVGSPGQSTGGGVQEVKLDERLETPDKVIAPYEQYELTQGLHGYSYGHMAIDISAGDGEPIKSPISGMVTGLFVDNLGNTTLILENDFYRITLLHGNYLVAFGQQVTIGELIGYESNQGNTYDALGRSCRGRDCGYHTHLNIYDKRLAGNVDPLSLFESLE